MEATYFLLELGWVQDAYTQDSISEGNPEPNSGIREHTEDHVPRVEILRDKSIANRSRRQRTYDIFQLDDREPAKEILGPFFRDKALALRLLLKPGAVKR